MRVAAGFTQVGRAGTSWVTDQGKDAIPMSGTDKAKNKIEDVGGKAKEAVGKATGDRDTEAEGKKDQTKADLKGAGEKVKDAFKH
jgi:uncharacterized protein YjbJ (UPF0337 family)